MRRLSFVLIGLVSIVPAASAQIGSRPRGGAEPGYWVGLSYGYVDGTTIGDRDTRTTWRFGYSSQIRATFEKTVQRGVTLGIGAGFSTAPLTYSNGVADVPCGECDARADVTQALAFVRGGGGVGFHTLYSLEAGVTEFSNFRAAYDGSILSPVDPKYDFTFGLGGGLGFGISPTTDIYVAEQLDFIMHPQYGAASSAPRFMTFRAGLRVGF